MTINASSEDCHVTELTDLRSRVSRLQQLLADTITNGDHPIVDTMFEGVQLIDTKYRYLYLNKAACAHARRQLHELIGRTMAECYPGIEDTEMFALLERCQTQRVNETMINQFTYPDKTQAWFELRFEPVPEGVLVLSVDITERRRMEEELRQTQKMEAMGQLAGGVAHDFNNVLTAIMSFTDLARGDLAAGKANCELFLDEVMKAVQQGAQLTRQLLTLSRSGTEERDVIAINEQITTFHHLLRRTLGSPIELVTLLTNEAITAELPPGQLQQVLLNLAVNARDAMKEGGTLIIATDVSDDGDHVIVSVRDTGVGMTAEARSRAFEPFYSTKGPAGTGLGLAICRRIVEQAGGTIELDSRPSCGTTVTIRLPRSHQHDHIVANPESIPTLSAADLDGPVLVVEDKAPVLAAITEALRRRDIEVIPAHSAEQALANLERNDHPHLGAVISDIVLPRMSGYELIDALDDAGHHAPALLMTGHNGHDYHRARTTPTVEIAKPFTTNQLLNHLTTLLADKQPPE